MPKNVDYRKMFDSENLRDIFSKGQELIPGNRFAKKKSYAIPV